MSDDFFAPPPFKPAEALVALKRQLRELKLTERGAGFEWKGLPVVQLTPGDGAIDAKLVRRLLRTPEWTTHRLASAPDVRKFIDAVGRVLRGAADDD